MIKKMIILSSLLLSTTISLWAQEVLLPPDLKELPPVVVDTVAKEDNPWKFGSDFILGFSQASFTNWKAGGENSISLLGKINSSLVYTKNKSNWDNKLELAYGLAKQGDKDMYKTDDKIELNSVYSHRATTHWAYSSIFKFSTQFAKGYATPEDTVYVSDFMIPARMLLTLGMQYLSPNKQFSFFFSPLGLNSTYVADVAFAPSYGIEPNEHWYFGVGAFMRVEYTTILAENIKLATKVDVFTDYLTPQFEKSTSITWDLRLDMKINKFLTTSLETGLIYDPKVFFEEINENNEVVSKNKVQFKEVFMLNLMYSF